MKKDKQKVIDEILNDERLQALITAIPEPDRSAKFRDHRILLRAYRHLRADDFSRFIAIFQAAGLNLNGKDEAGKTVLQTISGHDHSSLYLEALVTAGAEDQNG